MTPKHTPGPWRVLDKHPDRSCLHVVSGDEPPFHYPLAMLYTAPGDPNRWPSTDGDPHADDPERVANAQLMASAPELLAALQDALACFLLDHAHDHPTANNWRAAIAKALGQSPQEVPRVRGQGEANV